MHLENHRIKKTVPLFYASVLTVVILFYFFSTLYDFYFWLEILFYGLIVGILFLIYKVFLFFKYDSSTDSLIFKNSGLFLSHLLNYRDKQLEIKKGKLIKFEFKNYFICFQLKLVYKQNFQVQSQTFLFSFVSRKRMRDLKYSLTKALEIK